MNSPFLKALLFLAMSWLLASCASLSKNECLYADWYQIGLEDGTVGKGQQQRARHRKACAKAAVTPDFNEYERGYQQGLQHYCNYQNGLLLGSRGAALPTFCPDNKRQEFELGHFHGRERHEQQRIINALVSEIEQLQQSAVTMHDRKQILERLIIRDGTTKKERILALNEMRDIDYQLRVIEANSAILATQYHEEVDLMNALIRQQQQYQW